MIGMIQGLKKRVADALSSLQGDVAKAREAIQQTRGELAHAEGAPGPKDELIATARELVGRASASWRSQHGREVVRALAGDPPPERLTRGGDLGPRRPRLPFDPDVPPLTFRQLCGLAPAVVLAGLEEIVQAMDYRAGPPIADRPAIIARLTADLATLETQEEALVDEAAEEGVVIAHRPEVVQRRETEARQRQLQEGVEQDRLRRQAALDVAHAQRPRRTHPSEYLAKNRVVRPE